MKRWIVYPAVILIYLLCQAVLGYVSYLWGEKDMIDKEESLCKDSVEELEQKDLRDCKKAVDETIMACSDVCRKTCLEEMQRSCPLIKGHSL
jgi:hypothetical protein